MTEEDKQLLLKDLCARQMYNAKCQVFNDVNPYRLSGILHNKPHSQLYFEELDWKEYDGFVNVEYCKPYLFPLSSMTEEQRNEFLNIQSEERKILFDALVKYRYEKEDKIPIIPSQKHIDWLNKNKFDYRGLIPMGLAIDATHLNVY